MNIKSKLIEQLGVLENLQLFATNSGAFDTALSTSRTILEYIREIDNCDNELPNECGYNDICPDCKETLATEKLHRNIAIASNLPIEVVKKILVGQDEASGIE